MGCLQRAHPLRHPPAGNPEAEFEQGTGSHPAQRRGPERDRILVLAGLGKELRLTMEEYLQIFFLVYRILILIVIILGLLIFINA